MDAPFQVLLDAPGEPVKRIQIAKLGPVTDSRYGDFEITSENVENWQRNLSALPGGEALIDFEHRSERKPRDSRAAGWITNVDIDGDRVMADARWTPEGEKAIKDGVYRFMSPAYGPFTNDKGELFDDTLVSAALTNKPALTMPALMLASAERVSEAIDEDPALRFYTAAENGELGEIVEALVLLDVTQAERDKAKAAGNSLPDGSYPINNTKQLRSAAILAASGHGDVKAAKALIRRRAKELGVDVTTLNGFGPKKMSADSPAAEMQTDTLIKTLELEDDADETKILEAIQALKTPVEPEPVVETKTLEQQAQEAGMIVLDSETVRQLQKDAKDGAAAALLLHEQRFDHAFEDALKNAEGAKVTPAERESLHHFYTLDADATLKLIEDRAPIVSGKPKGAAAIDVSQLEDADDETQIRAGHYPGRIALDQKVHAKLKELGRPETDYAKVLAQMMERNEL